MGGQQWLAERFEENRVRLRAVAYRLLQSLPNDVRLKLELLDERRFGAGVVYLRYRSRTWGDGDAAGRLGRRSYVRCQLIAATLSSRSGPTDEIAPSWPSKLESTKGGNG